MPSITTVKSLLLYLNLSKFKQSFKYCVNAISFFPPILNYMEYFPLVIPTELLLNLHYLISFFFFSVYSSHSKLLKFWGSVTYFVFLGLTNKTFKDILVTSWLCRIKLKSDSQFSLVFKRNTITLLLFLLLSLV